MDAHTNITGGEAQALERTGLYVDTPRRVGHMKHGKKQLKIARNKYLFKVVVPEKNKVVFTYTGGKRGGVTKPVLCKEASDHEGGISRV